MTAPATPAKRLPASIWALGFVSLLMDVSSEMIHSLLPVFLVTSLGSACWPWASSRARPRPRHWF